MKSKTFLPTLIFFILASIQSKASSIAVSKTYGFNTTDATSFLQRAFDSEFDTIVIDYVGKDWVTKPLFVKSNKVLIFEPGVVIMAKAGEFHGESDCLFTITNASNITMIGYGATFRMRKTDYQNSGLYTTSEYRHTLQIQAYVDQPVENITVKGFHFELSGGDGILVSGISGYPDHDPVQPKNVLIQDVVCDRNYRDAISVCGGENVNIVNAVMEGTSGTSPQAGIDWEPDWERQINVGMNNCLFYNNTVTGLQLFLYRPAWRGPTDISMVFNNCHIDSDNGKQGVALSVSSIDDNGTPGTIVFNDCSFKNKTIYNTLNLSDKSALKARLTFNRCFMEQTNSIGKIIGLSTANTASKNAMTYGGIDFNDCTINDKYNRNFISFSDNAGTGKGIRDIKGNVVVNNPFGAKSDFGTLAQDMNLQITENKTNPPVLNITSPLLLQKYMAGDPVNIKVTASDPDAGTSNGAGIAKVLFEIRYADNLVYSAENLSAPFEGTINTTGWQAGIYLIKAIAVSQDFNSRNICVRAFEIIPKPVIPTTIIDSIAPTKPAGLTSSAITENSFILSWIASSDNRKVKGYEVFKDGLSSGTTTDTFLKIEGITCNSAYSMTVTAIDTMLNVSGASNALQVVTSACITDLQAPSVPVNLSATDLNNNSFLLSWDASTDNVGVKGYEVFKNGLSVGTTDSTSFKLTGLTCNTSYKLTVKAYDASKNQSDSSLTLNVTTTACYYEAENEKLNGGVIAHDHAGYSGTGFWADVKVSGDYAQFNVISATGGSSIVTCRYSAGLGNQAMSLYVNGSKIKQLVFPITINWETWANKNDTVMLNSGSNTIKYQYDPNDNGQINIDYINISPINYNSVSSLEENELLIYPNPLNSVLTIANLPTNARISVITINGRIVKTLNAQSEVVNIDVKDWTPGLYLISIKTDKKVLMNRVIVK